MQNPLGEVCWRGAHELAAAIRRRQLSVTEVVGAHLGRIEAVNPLVNAVVSLVPERALAEAAEADRAIASGARLGPLHGLPIAIKDLMDTVGIRTTYGSRIYADHVPAADSLLVGRLRKAGAIVVGKTNTPEFGAGSHTFNEVFGITRNPYDLTRTAGGSSGGAAAALASGMLPLADGSDLGGSLRNPAAYCNVVGLRPSPGRVGSTRPGNAWDPSSTLGPMARNVADVALMLAVIAGPDPRAPLAIAEDPASFARLAPRDLRGIRIAFSRDADGLPVDDAIAAVHERFRAVLSGLGAQVTDLEPDLSGADEAFETFRALEFLDSHGTDVLEHPELVKQTVRQDVGWGRSLTAEQIVRAGRLRTDLFRRTQALFEHYQLLVLPTAQLPPFPVEQEWPTEVAGVAMARYYTWQRSCTRISATALPALSLPAGFTADGLPVGAQLVGRHRGELELLGYAATIEAATDLRSRHPADIEPHARL
jgi:amidase